MGDRRHRDSRDSRRHDSSSSKDRSSGSSSRRDRDRSSSSRRRESRDPRDRSPSTDSDSGSGPRYGASSRSGRSTNRRDPDAAAPPSSRGHTPYGGSAKRYVRERSMSPPRSSENAAPIPASPPGEPPLMPSNGAGHGVSSTSTAQPAHPALPSGGAARVESAMSDILSAFGGLPAAPAPLHPGARPPPLPAAFEHTPQPTPGAVSASPPAAASATTPQPQSQFPPGHAPPAPELPAGFGTPPAVGDQPPTIAQAPRTLLKFPEYSFETEEDQNIMTAIKGALQFWPKAAHQSASFKPFPQEMLHRLLRRARTVLMQDNMLVEVAAPVNICGDLHGQIHDLKEIFQVGGVPPVGRYLFLGDYVDRGRNSVEVAAVLLGLKVLFPTHVYLLRGNHEDKSLNSVYGFFEECKQRYSTATFKIFNDVFSCLPISALVENQVLCMHGGISPELMDLQQIAKVERPLASIGDRGFVCDLMWADPDSRIGWNTNGDRGVSYTFGEDVLLEKLRQLDIEMVVRAHQVQEDGYSFFGDRGLVTIFSASNYTGTFSNYSAMLVMDEQLVCSFRILKPVLPGRGIFARGPDGRPERPAAPAGQKALPPQGNTSWM